MVKITFLVTHLSYLAPLHSASNIVTDKFGLKVDCCIKTGKDLDAQSVFDEFLQFAKQSHIVIVHLLGNAETVPAFKRFLKVLHDFHVPIFIATIPFNAELMKYSNIESPDAATIFQYLNYGGAENLENLLLFLANRFTCTGFPFIAPKLLPWDGVYHPCLGYFPTVTEYLQKKIFVSSKPVVGVLFHQVAWRNNETTYVDSLIKEIERQGANVIPVFISAKSVDSSVRGLKWAVESCFMKDGKPIVDVVLSTLSFSVSVFLPYPSTADKLFMRLGVPVLKVIATYATLDEWEKSPQGLTPVELSWNLALPEFDGLLITVPCATKKYYQTDASTSNSSFTHEPINERVNKLVRLSLNWAKLRHISNSEKKVAIIFHNYPPRNDDIGNSAGLDSAASVFNILNSLQEHGYQLDYLPKNGQELLNTIINGLTNDRRWLSNDELARRAVAKISKKQCLQWFNELPIDVKEKMLHQWGKPPGKLFSYKDDLLVPGILDGHVFIGLQPSRGFLDDPASIYHSPDVPPPHQYCAYYRWIRDVFKANVILHIGKHGSLEWLPGKAVGLSESCFPDIVISDLPNIYPYIINNPGEGTQAKRRSYCCIIDHLVPVMHNADTYDEISKLEVQLQEYYHAKTVDKTKVPILQELIWENIVETKLDQDLQVTKESVFSNFDGFLERLHGYLSELSDTLIRDGLHILGEPPKDSRLEEFIVSLTRLSNGSVPSLRQSIAELNGYNYEELLANRGKLRFDNKTNGEVLKELTDLSLELIKRFSAARFSEQKIDKVQQEVLGKCDSKVTQCLSYICRFLVPALAATTSELNNILSACNGGYVSAGPSGSITRGMADILPTGRNFYSVDPRAIPSGAAWRVGVALGDALLDRYLKEEGKYPESIAFVVWATDTMKTKGDDIAEILYLMGVKPVWAESTGRVVGLEVIALDDLKRPRIDVTIRISGMFRDAFLNVAHLLDEAVTLVSSLKESNENNYVIKHVKNEVNERIKQGIEAEKAQEEALYRIFSDPPGAYGCGISKAVDSKNWKNPKDLADVYVTWSCYAYSRKVHGCSVPEQFKLRLSQVNVTVKNDDSRESDILIADDWYDYHGGLINAVKTFKGAAPRSYCGDSSDPDRVKIRSTAEETCHVFRSRLLNPKYINSMKRHGYKGASDLSRSVDYVLGWDATADTVEDWMYEKLAEKYALDEDMQEWLKEVNPFALQNITERLLEAIERGLWDASDDMKKQLQQLYLQVEGLLEDENEKKESNSKGDTK